MKSGDLLPPIRFDRRTFLKAAAALYGVRLLPASKAFGESTSSPRRVLQVLNGPEIDLTIGATPIRVGGRVGLGTTINGGLPGPELRFKEGQEVLIRVHNTLKETTSLHWHGIPLTVIQADGQPLQPIEVDELRIAIAETYDVIVEPTDDVYTIFAETKEGSRRLRPGHPRPRPGHERSDT